MANIVELNKKLHGMVLSGKALEEFDERYAEPIVMQENSDAPFVGKALNRVREIAFFSSIGKIHSAAVLASAVDGDVSFFGMGNRSNL